MPTNAFQVLVGAMLLAALLADLHLLAPHNPTSAVYAVPILIATLRMVPRAVVVTSGIAVLLFLVSALLQGAPPNLWGFGFASLIVVGVLATLVSSQQYTILKTRHHLQQTLTDLRAVLDAVDSGILTFDRDGRLRIVNYRLADWFGLDLSHIVGQPVERVVRESIAPKVADPNTLLARLAWGREHLGEIGVDEVKQAQPVHRVMRLYSGPVCLGETLVGGIVVATDVTEIRRRLEEREALRQVGDALVRERTLAGVATVIAAQTLHVLDAKAAALFLADPTPSELRLIAQRGLPDSLVEEIQQIPITASIAATQAARTGEPVEVTDYLALNHDLAKGREWAKAAGVRSSLAQPLFSKGRLIGVLILLKAIPHHFGPDERGLIQAFSDLAAVAIENARLYEEAVRRRQEAEDSRIRLQQFLAMVSHELRTPLTSILGYTQILRKHAGEKAPETEQRQLLTIEQSAWQMRRLIDDLLDAARIGAGRFGLKPAPMDLVTVTREVAEAQQATTDKHCLIEEGPSHLEGIWDKARIRQLLTNLISNAIRYSPNGGEVRITLGQVGEEARIRVTDQGVGIAPERLRTLFQPFVYLEDADKLTDTGLGLYISKAIVESHGGRIWVESELGKGSSVFVALPLGERHRETADERRWDEGTDGNHR